MTKSIYLVRHAKSSWKFPDLPDIDRPLNKRGQRDVPTMTDRLKTLNFKVDLVISSPAERAKTTALYLASELSRIESVLLLDPLYHANTTELFQEISLIDNKHNSVMLVGHNPGLTTFTNLLGNLKIENIPTCGIVGFDLPIKEWSQLKYGNANLLFFDYPKKANN